MRLISALAYFFCSGVLVAAQTPTDRIEFDMGGVVSGLSEINIDLTTGATTNTHPDYNSESRSPKTIVATLTPAQTEYLKGAARTAIAAGLEKQECVDARRTGSPVPPPKPVMDAIPDLRIYLDGRLTVGSMVITCWTKAADDFVATLLHIVPNR